ncbi:MAG TPA: dNTP triphosphohydrolase [Gaiellaceae bacterium]
MSRAETPPEHYDKDDIAREHLPLDEDDDRERFCRDYDRLVHSPAFRRLQGKTQVVSPGEADFFRTRLTHTIEVAQVARRIASMEGVGVNRDLCEASAVLHDLGHPCFAHIGEETLNEVMDDWAKEWGLPVDEVGGFNGNAQSFRLAVKSLSHSSAFRGLDLTRGVLDGAVKYPYERDAKGVPNNDSDDHWCFYPTERKEAGWVRQGVPPEREFEQSLEAQVVDWADDVAYSIHDVEDWYRAGFMPLEMLVAREETRIEFGEKIKGKLAEEEGIAEEAVVAAANDLFAGPAFAGITRAYDGSRQAKEGVKQMRSVLFDEFTKVELRDLAGRPARHGNDLAVDPKTRLRNKILKQLLWIYVITHPRMATHQLGQARIVRELFDLHVKALKYDPQKAEIDKKADLKIFSPDTEDALRAAAADKAELLRMICDHIAGMTDGYAMRLHARLTGSEPGLFNAFV